MGKDSEQIVCPYCGQTQETAPRCRTCGGLFDAFSLTATEIEMGPWFVRDEGKPFLPGCSYNVLRKRIETGRIKKDTILRGPTTRQLWMKAGHTPCVAHLLGTCHACGAEVKPADTKCKACSAVFGESTERQELGLRFRTSYAAATARLELDKQIAETKAAEARAKQAATERKKQAIQAAKRKPMKVEDQISEGWDWRAAPKNPSERQEDDDAEDAITVPAMDREIEKPDDNGRRPALAARTVVYDASASGARSVFSPTGASLAAVQSSQSARPTPLIGSTGWCWMIVLSLLFVVLFRFFLERMALIAVGDGNWSHALFIPVISAWFIYHQRDKLIRIIPRINPWGLPIFFAGLISYAFWLEPGRNDMLKGYSLIVALFGMVLFLLGNRMMRILWLPIFYLTFAVKVSPAIWERVAAKLQNLASHGSTIVLQFFGGFMDLNAERRGTTIVLSYMKDGVWVSGQELNVAEACSGLRMLAAFMALGVLVAFATPRARWQRVVLVLLTVPIALLVNIGRVTVLGLLYPINRNMAAGDFHIAVGLLMLVLALGLFMFAGWILDRIYVYEEGAHNKTLPSEAASEATSDTPLAITPMQRINSVVKGSGTGAVLCLLIALAYGLGLFALRPDLASKDFTRSLSLQLLTGVAAALLFWAWVVRRQILPEIHRPRQVGRFVSMSLMAGVMAMSVVLLGGIVSLTKAVMIKESISLRQPVYRIPTKIGVWERVRDDPALSSAQEDELGTRSYISRYYQDTSLEPGAPGRLVKLHVAYYTGTPDTVPHVPERCFVAGGLRPVSASEARIVLKGPRYRKVEAGFAVPSQLEPEGVILPGEIQATLFTFAEPDNPEKQGNVIYFFSANGKYLHTPELVRLNGFDPRDRYSYYCKIEVLLPDVTNPTDAAGRASAFLSEVMPEIVACLPNWFDVKQGKWPKQG